MHASLEEARKAKEQAKRLLAGLDFVVGIGISGSEGEYVLKVNLREGANLDKIPASVSGIPVKTEVVGEISKQSAKSSF